MRFRQPCCNNSCGKRISQAAPRLTDRRVRTCSLWMQWHRHGTLLRRASARQRSPRPRCARGGGHDRNASWRWPRQRFRRSRRERDLRLDLFRGIALWLIFLDHIPENIVNWFTIRNYGFSDATEIFIFISGYTAAFVYGRAMRERGFVDLQRAHPAPRLADLCRAHFSVHDLHGRDRLCRGDLRQSALRRGNEYSRFPQAAGRHDLSGAAVEVQARQHGRAAALHRSAAAVSADAAVCCCGSRPSRSPARRWSMCWPGISIGICPPIRTASGSSIRSPGNCCSCSAPGARSAARKRLRRRAALAHRAGRRHRLPAVCLRDHADLVLRIARSGSCRIG